jgi:GAF domain-containing protein
VLRLAAHGAGADLANHVLPVGDDPANGWSATAATGLMADRVVGLPIDAESAVKQVIESSKPLLIDDYASAVGDAGIYGVPGSEVVVGSMVCAPLLAGQQVVGVLSVGRVAGRGSFTETDMDQLTLFAGHAWLALELAQAREARDALAWMEDHDRIAAELHNQVIQELFATGMGLEGLVHLLPSDGHRQRVLGYVDAIDSTIHRIRQTIFQCRTPATLARHPYATPCSRSSRTTPPHSASLLVSRSPGRRRPSPARCPRMS